MSVSTDVPLLEEPPAEEKPKKKPKKPKLTKAQKKALALKAAQDFQKLEMRTKLAKELQLGKKSEKRGILEWMNLASRVRLDNLLVDLETTEIKAHRMIKRKDEHIKMLTENIQEVSEMHRRAYAHHVQMLQYLTDLFDTLYTTTKQVYEANCQDIVEDLLWDKHELNESFEETIKRGEQGVHAMDVVITETLQEEYDIFVFKQHDIVNSEILKRYNTRDNVVATMRDHYTKLLAFLSELRGLQLDPRKYERIIGLQDKHRQTKIEAKNLNANEYRLLKQYITLQREGLRREKEFQAQVMELRKEQHYYLMKRHDLETIIADDETETKTMIREFVCQGEPVLERFRRLLSWGENLLILCATCRKYQTEREKVFIWGDTEEPKYGFGMGDPAELEELVDKFRLTISTKVLLDREEDSIDSDLEILQQFWRRAAIAQAQCAAMKRERARLNAGIQHYLDIAKQLSRKYTTDDLFELITYQGSNAGKSGAKCRCRMADRKEMERLAELAAKKK